MSEAAVNSALQRARAGLKEHLPEKRNEWQGAELDPGERALLDQYMKATELGDAQLVAETLAEDVRFSMPPQEGLWIGRDSVVGGWVEGGFGDAGKIGEFRCTLTFANRQPAVANYLRKPGDDTFRAFAIDVLAVSGGKIVDITTFDAPLFAAFGLPEAL
jgi:RNA polymerase sigma-70 factor (ECF subfamily)